MVQEGGSKGSSPFLTSEDLFSGCGACVEVCVLVSRQGGLNLTVKRDKERERGMIIKMGKEMKGRK